MSQLVLGSGPTDPLPEEGVSVVRARGTEWHRDHVPDNVVFALGHLGGVALSG